MKQDNANQLCRQETVSPALALKFMDALSIIGGLWLLVNVIPEVNSKTTIVVSLIAIGLFYIFADVVGLYRRWHGLGFYRELGCAVLAWALTISALTMLGRFSEYSTEISAPAIVQWFAATLTFSLSFRVWVRWYHRYRAKVRARNSQVCRDRDQ